MHAVSATSLAELAVALGANVQQDQIVTVGAYLGQEEMARELAAAAYRRGARFVDVTYFDPYAKRARIEHARAETLGFVPSWYGERMLELGRQRAARISLAGPAPPDALAGLDPERAGRDQLPFIKEVLTVINERLVNWTVVPAPTQAWAELVHPRLSGAEALERLWQEIAHVCRLDEPDAVAAWAARADELDAVARRLDGAAFDALHFEGPGTDLVVGLFPAGRWETAGGETVDGIRHMANLPSEEIFTTPDPGRTEGVVASTRPLALFDGPIVRGLTVRFEGGSAVAIEADEGAEILRGRAAVDEGAARLGEVALVDRESRIGLLGTTFLETLLDENAVSHIALGDGDPGLVGEGERSRVNKSATHIDFMIGGDDVDVTGVERGGARVPVLRGGAWQI
ncbi:MAG TPA: aminopeptidase [Gaiellaceae bacterium]|nr:aminopeptidase [Gaiellaceae bacterium]